MQQNIQDGLKQLMQRDMDRKDFLKHVGIGVVSIVGLSAAIKTVSQLGTQKPSSTGYGSDAYGGVSRAPSVTKRS